MESDMFTNDKPVVINKELAVILGLSESIIIQQMNCWLEKSTYIIEERPWIFNSYSSWQKQLPFFCESTIRRLIRKLEDMEIMTYAVAIMNPGYEVFIKG